MKSLTLISTLLAVAVTVAAAPYAWRTASHPTGPPPTSAKLVAYVAGTEKPFGYIAANGSLIPTLTQANEAPTFTLTTTITARANIFNVTAVGPTGSCGFNIFDIFDCTSPAATSPGISLRIENTVYGWEIDVEGNWFWYQNPPRDVTTARTLHPTYEQAKGQAPVSVMAIPIAATA